LIPKRGLSAAKAPGSLHQQVSRFGCPECSLWAKAHRGAESLHP